MKLRPSDIEFAIWGLFNQLVNIGEKVRLRDCAMNDAVKSAGQYAGLCIDIYKQTVPAAALALF
jgi:hypothetical protein